LTVSTVEAAVAAKEMRRWIAWLGGSLVAASIFTALALAGLGAWLILPAILVGPGVGGVALIWLAIAWRFGASFFSLRLAIFATLLVGVAVTDLRTYTIPDGFTISGFVFVLLTAFIAMFFGGEVAFAGPFSAILGACTGAGAIAIVGWLGEAALKKEAMGFGDVTLMAFIGAAVGPELALLTVFVGAAIGAVVFLAVVVPVSKLRGKEMPQVPFGVFLSPAALVTLLYGRQMIAAYLTYLAGA